MSLFVGEAQTGRPAHKAGCRLGKKPSDDRGYLEAMAEVIFSLGLSRSVVEGKWDGFREVFSNFVPEKVARLSERDLERLMTEDRIIRNYNKIAATVENAKTFLAIRDELGSFRRYLELFSGAGEAALCKELSKRFSFLGGSSAVFFLRAVGEELPETMRRWELERPRI